MTRNRGVVAYIRTSTHRQDGKLQVAMMRERLAAEGLPDLELLVELGKSGREGNKRPLFEQLKEDICRKRVQTIYFYDLSRLGRSLQDNLDFFKLCTTHNVGLKALAQDIDLTTPSGRAMAQILSVFAEYQRALAREGCIAYIRGRQAQELPVGRRSKIQAQAKQALWDLYCEYEGGSSFISYTSLTKLYNMKFAATYGALGRTTVHRLIQEQKGARGA